MAARLQRCTAFPCCANLALAALFSAGIILSIALSPASAATVGPGEMNKEKKPVSPEERQRLQKRVYEVKGLLEEARRGKRDDVERYVLLRHLLTSYASLQMENVDPQVRSAKHEWDELLRKHPEFTSNPPPLEIREQRELREQTEARELELDEKGEAFVPKDTRAKVYWSGNRLVAVYQFRIEFFELPGGIEPHIEYGGTWQALRGKGKWQGAGFEIRFKKNGNFFDLTPKKTITFGRKIGAEGGCRYSSDTCEHIAVYTEGVYPGYSPSAPEESEILRRLHAAGKPHQWSNPRADHQEFYGVVGIDGKVLAEIPFKANPPGKIARVLYVYSDGTALFGIGSAVSSEADPDYLRFGAVDEVVSWSKTDGVTREPVQKAKKRHPELDKSMWLK